MGVYPLSVNSPRRAVFLDRDGVIIRAIVRSGKPYPPASIHQVEILPEARQILGALAAVGFLLIVITNQPDVARGAQSSQVVETIHAYLKNNLPLDQILTCYHDDQDQCTCRKPAPGLLLEAALTHGIDLNQSFMIGDRWRDIEAGQRAGCKTIFINYDYAERQPESPTFCVHSLGEAVEVILSAIKEEREIEIKQ
jgi:D-glycero-D-manno-heptose 1,7-bisphosphate phosphatase